MLRYILLNKMELLIKQQMIYTENETLWIVWNPEMLRLYWHMEKRSGWGTEAMNWCRSIKRRNSNAEHMNAER